ncbi:MAG: hypothetical protein E6J62_02930 [Deltaproteobacteria bacterium]|nr:MAG: hypothetical protein E6J61_16380 [Deltaproteobacteria bacterium]TMB38763.1 MAG: hypothetical protein E6J62_02930 [Deltaproteobacteria bacterium]
MRAAIVCAFLMARTAIAAPEDSDDLDRIPRDLPHAQTIPTTSRQDRVHLKIYFENAATLAARRDVDIPFPPPLPYDFQNRTSLDSVIEWRPVRQVKLVLSDRADLVEQESLALMSKQTVRNELREAYVSWEPFARTYVDAGRINAREGTALGFNPTDFFRPGTLVGQASLDPSVLSRNRLGTVMLRAQAIWDGGSVSALYAPRLFAPSAIKSALLGIDPRFAVTNAADRGLAKITWNLGDTSAEALLYLETHRSKVGFDVTRPVGQSVIAYAEWAGGYDEALIARAIGYGRETGTLPRDAPPPIPTQTARSFHNDLAVGGSWTIAAAVTFNLEYHLHQGGLSRNDWERWSGARRDIPALANELWYIRGYASDQLEPATRQQLFLRAAAPKAFVDRLELDGFSFVSLADGSTLTQITASYYLSDAWTAAFSASANLGSSRSERGSFPQVISGIVQLVRYQ